MIKLTQNLIKINQINQLVEPHHQCGGHVWFVGTVRSPNKNIDVTKLFFEAYEPMAIKELQQIYNEAIKKYKLENLLIHHRLGSVFTGEIAVVIVASAIHRKEAFLGCEYVIDELKKRAPIWKKEYSHNQSQWVSCGCTP